MCTTESWCVSGTLTKYYFVCKVLNILTKSKKNRSKGVISIQFTTILYLYKTRNSLAFKVRSVLSLHNSEIELLTTDTINKKNKDIQYKEPVDVFDQYKTYLKDFFRKLKNSDKAIYILRDHKQILFDWLWDKQ